MKRFINSRLSRIASVILIGAAGLYGQTANAEFFEQQTGKACMAEAAGFALNCTANDIQVSKVDNVRDQYGNEGEVECTLGEPVTFMADVTIVTTANERYNYTVYLPEGNYSAQDPNPPADTCSILLGQADGNPGVDIDGDVCADISKAKGFSPTHLYKDEVITLTCRDDDNSGQAEFNYCAAWENKESGLCSEANPAVPGTPSKCRCDSFDIDIFIRPEPPAISKTLVGTDTYSEPGGEYTFDVSFTNESRSSIFLTSMLDMIDEGADGSYETSVDLWDTPVTPNLSTEGVYLTDTSCAEPNFGGDYLSGEVPPTFTYSCRFKVHIVDFDLPNDGRDAKELYDDVVLLTFVDERGSAVTNGQTCPLSLGTYPANGEYCSNLQQVNVTNLQPAISVTKEVDQSFVIEPGGDVEFTVTVKNEAAVGDNWDDPLEITSLTDTDFNLLVHCPDAIGTELAPQGTYECIFTEAISGNYLDQHSNTIAAIAIDNEADIADAEATATVDITDAVPIVKLVKTVCGLLDEDDPAVVDPEDYICHKPETGDTGTPVDVEYTFKFSVDSTAVDNVIFNKLEDVVPSGSTDPSDLTDLTALCEISEDSSGLVEPAQPLGSGYELAPGEWALCNITLQLEGNAGDNRHNTATIWGNDVDKPDTDPVFASDTAQLVFDNVPLDLAPEFAMKATAFVRIKNGGVDNIFISQLKFAGVEILHNNAGIGFIILDESSIVDYVEDDPLNGYYGPFDFCEKADAYGLPVIAPGDYYDCTFTLKLLPGFIPAGGDTNLISNTLFVEVKNADDNETDTGTVDVSIVINE